MAQIAADAPRPIPYAHSRRWKLIANSIWNVLLLLVTLAIIGAAVSVVPGSGARMARLLSTDMLTYALPAVPLSLLLASGEIDLSLAAIVGLAGILAAGLARNGAGLLGGLTLCLGMGLAVGLAHAALVGAGRLNGALVTFASGAALTGLVLVMSKGVPIVVHTTDAEVGLVNTVGWALTLLSLLVGVALIYFTPFVRRPGPTDPPESLVRRTLMVGLPFVTGGILAGMAGVVLVGRLQMASPVIASTYELRLILAVVIGGTPFGRGISNVFGALLGVVFTSALTTLLQLTNIDTTLILLSMGGVLVAAVLLVHLYHGLFGWIVGRRNASQAQSTPPAAEPPSEPPAEPDEKESAG